MKTMFDIGSDAPFLRHPLLSVEDTLKRALLSLGFASVYPDGGLEVEEANTEFESFGEPEEEFAWTADPITCAHGKTQLRTRILPGVLAKLTAEGTVPERFFCCGNVYRKDDAGMCGRRRIEGMYSVPEDSQMADWRLWNRMAEQIFGLGSAAWFVPTTADGTRIIMRRISDGKEFALGYAGVATDKAVIASVIPKNGRLHAFSLDVDGLASALLGIDREQLYSNDPSYLESNECALPSAGNSIEDAACDVLRRLRYTQFVGNNIYPDGIYKKMNMFQGEWDTNNQPYVLDEPQGDLVALRTVLAPSLEDALSASWAAGRKDCHIFEIGHAYKPVPGATLPREWTSVSIGAYGPDVDEDSFLIDVGKFLTQLGLCGETLAPTRPGQAIAFKDGVCKVLLSSSFKYLEAQMGSISPIALENFGIGTQAYMAQFELAPLVESLDK